MKYSIRFNKKIGTWILALILAIGFLAGTIINRVMAEAQTVTAWVLCQPGDYVNARVRPSRRSESTGRFECGDTVELDGETEEGFAHVVGPNLESGAYWMHTGYLSFDEPEWYGDEMEIIGKARVAARKNMAGEVRVWLQPGTVVQVFWITEEWAVTNRGFIRTEWLDVASVE